MGNEAVNTVSEEVEENIDEILGLDQPEEKPEAEDVSKTTDDTDSDTHPVKAIEQTVPLTKHLKAKHKLKSKAEEAEERAARAEAEAERLRGLVAQQTLPDDDLPPVIPTEASCGYDPDEFQKQVSAYNRNLAEWNASQTRKVIQQAKLEEQRGVSQQQIDERLNQSIEAHYERAEKLGIKSFDKLEEKVVNAIGVDAVKHITMLTDNSEKVIAYLGAKPEELAKLQHVMRTDPGKAIFLVGQYSQKVNSHNRKQSNAPEPETEITGGAGKGTDWQTRLDRARDRSMKTGNSDEVMRIRKEMKALGLTPK
jgi:hypothetical protein